MAELPHGVTRQMIDIAIMAVQDYRLASEAVFAVRKVLPDVSLWQATAAVRYVREHIYGRHPSFP